MDALIMKSGKDTPFVSFNTDNNVFDISGESYTLLPNEFYEPILQWLHDYLPLNTNPITVNIQLNYFNTATYYPLCEILRTLERYQEGRGIKVTVNWFAHQDDREMLNDIQLMKSGLQGLFFQVLPLQTAA